MQAYFSTLFNNKHRGISLVVGERVQVSVNWRNVGNIASSEWFSETNAVALEQPAVSGFDASVYLFVMGPGRIEVTNRVTLSDGDIKEQVFDLSIIPGKLDILLGRNLIVLPRHLVFPPASSGYAPSVIDRVKVMPRTVFL